MIRTYVVSAALAVAVALSAHAQSADLFVTKSGPAEAVAGSRVTYGVTVTNLGPDPAAGITLSDPVPAGMTFFSAAQISGPASPPCTTPPVGDPGTVVCTIAALALNESATYQFEFDIPPDAAPGTTFTNIATASAQSLDENPENDSGITVTTTPPPPQSDVFISKNGPSNAAPGTDVTFDINVGNGGPAVSDLVWEDVLPGTLTFVSLDQLSGPTMICTTPAAGANGTVSCSAASFGAGLTAVFQLTVHIPADTPSGTLFTNTATVSAKNEDPNEENNAAVTSVTVSSVDVSVVKTGPGTATAGSVVNYTITVANAGPDPALAVVLVDELPPGTTLAGFSQNSGPPSACNVPVIGTHGTIDCSFGTLSPGQPAEFALSINAGTAASVTNTATVTTESADLDPSNDEDSVTTTLTPSADLAVTKDGPPSAAAGTNVTYTVTLTNAGPSAAADVSLTDAVPAGTTFVSATQTSGPAFICGFAAGTITCTRASFAAGATSMFQFTFQIPPGGTGPVVNTAEVQSTTGDPDADDNSSTDTTAVFASADLGVVKSGPTGVSAGTAVSYTVVVSNAGPSDAAAVTLSDAAPPNTTVVSATQDSGPPFLCAAPPASITCTAATFPAGATASFTFVFNVAPGATGSVQNTATVSAAADSNAANNSSSATTPIGVTADLSVTKTGPASVAAGTNVTYTVTVGNGGPSDAANVTLTDDVPDGTTFVSATQTSGPVFSCGTAAGTTTCSIATLARAATATFELVYAVSPATLGPVSNTTTIASTTGDPALANNSATATTPVTPGTTDLAISKTASASTVAAGSTVTYTLLATNNGPAFAFDVVVTDTLPAGTTLFSATSTQGTCTGTTTVQCDLGTLAPNAEATITLIVQVPQSLGPLANTASISAANVDPVVSNDDSTVSIEVVSPASVPALSPLMMVMLAAVLAVVGLAVQRV